MAAAVAVVSVTAPPSGPGPRGSPGSRRASRGVTLAGASPRAGLDDRASVTTRRPPRPGAAAARSLVAPGPGTGDAVWRGFGEKGGLAFTPRFPRAAEHSPRVGAPRLPAPGLARPRAPAPAAGWASRAREAARGARAGCSRCVRPRSILPGPRAPAPLAALTVSRGPRPRGARTPGAPLAPPGARFVLLGLPGEPPGSQHKGVGAWGSQGKLSC